MFRTPKRIKRKDLLEITGWVDRFTAPTRTRAVATVMPPTPVIPTASSIPWWPAAPIWTKPILDAASSFTRDVATFWQWTQSGELAIWSQSNLLSTLLHLAYMNDAQKTEIHRLWSYLKRENLICYNRVHFLSLPWIGLRAIPSFLSRWSRLKRPFLWLWSS